MKAPPRKPPRRGIRQRRMKPTTAARLVEDGLGPDMVTSPDRQSARDELASVNNMIAGHLNLARISRGLPVPELCSRLTGQIQPASYYRWESGEVKLTAARIWELSVLLEQPVSYFFSGISEAVKVTESLSDLDDIITPEGLEAMRIMSVLSETRRRALMGILQDSARAEAMELEQIDDAMQALAATPDEEAA